VVSYEQLLSAFWNGHDAAYMPYSIQYRSAIFYTGDQQKELAKEGAQVEQNRLGKEIYTAVESFTGFYVAEDYHQKYYLRQIPEVVKDLYAIYPDPADFRDSTAAARLNGYLGGYGNLDTLKKNLTSFGLSNSGQKALIQETLSGLAPACPVG
jgi:peptide-methionine (S)-S-oxide reductase